MTHTPEKFYTCSKCTAITDEEWTSFLDDKPLCYTCMKEARFGEKERECAARGYHSTATHTGGIGDAGKDGETWYTYVRVTCACNCQAVFRLENPRCMGLLGWGAYSFAAPPRRWFVLDGQPTVLPDEVEQPAE